MTSHEIDPADPNQLTLQQMQEELFSRGWGHSVNDLGVPIFSRSYAVVNPVLANNTWRDIIARSAKVIEQRATHLQPSFGISTHGKDTELDLSIFGDKDDLDSVTKVYILDGYYRESGFEDIDETVLAEWMMLKGEPGAPKIGSKAHYEQNSRAAELRLLSLELMSDYRKVIMHEGAEGEAISRLLELNGKLAELAIEPAMHTGDKKVRSADPVERAEWIAGLLRDALRHGYGFSGNARALIAEHDLLAGQGNGRVMIDADASDEANTSIMLLMTFDNLETMLGATDEDS
jgi:hypothetical protein